MDGCYVDVEGADDGIGFLNVNAWVLADVFLERSENVAHRG